MSNWKSAEVYRNRLISALKCVVKSVHMQKKTIKAMNNLDWRVLSYDVDEFGKYWELEPDTAFTRVVFKRYNDGDKEAVACLLDVPANKGNVATYEHVGQHGEGDMLWAYGCSNANDDDQDVKDLKKELESQGYMLKVLNRFPSGFIRS